MRNTKLQSILQSIVIFGALMGLLLCLSACKKKPAGADASTTTEPSTTTQTEGLGEQTTPTTKPTYIPKPSEETTPSETTLPKVETVPNTCNHVLGNWIVDKVSTCTTEGSRYKECSLCKQKVETEKIPKTPHSPGAWIVDKKATCTAEGSQHQECSQCKEKLLYITVAKADHKVKPVSGVPATTSATGKTEGQWCSVCGTNVQNQYVIPIVNSVPYTYVVNSDNRTCTITGVEKPVGKELILPDTLAGYTVTAIGKNAFAGDSIITTVYIPSSVTSIGEKAFSGCSALINITYANTTAKWNTVAKGGEWNANTGSYSIYCTNNSLAK